VYTAENLYGVQPSIPGGTGGAGYKHPTSGMSISFGDIPGWRAFVDPHNPLFVFGLLLAATFGAIGVSGSARLGPAKLAADLGKA
jgi:hypothetical protein